MTNYTKTHKHRPSTQEILEDIKEKIILNDNILNGTAIIVKEDLFDKLDTCLRVVVCFKLNNIKYSFDFLFDTSYTELFPENALTVKQKSYERLYEELSRCIAQHLMQQIVI